MRDHYPKIAIIGAGISGIACARTLKILGHDNLAIFDKARGAGGRMSTRRDGDLRFDHGAQFFTIRNEEFAETMRPLREAGNVREWNATFLECGEFGRHPVACPESRWVGSPRMSSVTRALVKGVETKFETRVAPFERIGNRIALRDDDGNDLGEFDFVVVTAPAPQTSDLIRKTSPGLAALIDEKVSMLPCWALMLAFDQRQEPGFDALQWSCDHPVKWLARNTSKPGRDAPDSWIAHASMQWSSEHLEDSFDEAAGQLWDTLRQDFQDEPSFKKAHRWRYAMVERSLGIEAKQCEECPCIFVAGDWCRHGRIEAAFRSGTAAAKLVAGAI